MATPDLFALKGATRFNPTTPLRSSRSPSRSPFRKSQFTAREIDPLLSNLSPDSTLTALRATATITNEDVKQDALAKSIAEASPAEREIGIRAAVAAQKLKEWHQEVSAWSWPARRARGWGAGFLSPQKNTDSVHRGADVRYYGYLPALRVTEYRDRIEDIRDGIEALELEDIKDHVFSANVPQPSAPPLSPETPLRDSKGSGYGRLKDFTALITATVIQALPELAKLNMLLDTWDVRLSVLREIPDITKSFNTTRSGIHTAFSVVRSPETGPLVTMEEYEATKKILGEKVASLGAKIDKMLDLLEGQEDSLPKSWLDTLENTENDYAAWVVEAEHVAIRNGLLSKALAEQAKFGFERPVVSAKTNVRQSPLPKNESASKDDMLERRPVGTLVSELPKTGPLEAAPMKPPSPRKPGTSTKPPLSIPAPKGHNRGISEVSVADSAVSGISAAEILDAQSTKVLASPKISVVDNPLKGSREELSWLTPLNEEIKPSLRPPIIGRASTASVEVIPKDSVKQVTLIRSRSLDMLSQHLSVSSADKPSQDLRRSEGVGSNPRPMSEGPDLLNNAVQRAKSGGLPDTASSVSPSSSLRVKPLMLRAKGSDDDKLDTPELPRRSSKRLSQSSALNAEQVTPLATISAANETSTPSPEPLKRVTFDTTSHDGTLEAKIQDILNTMPTKIRLARDSESDENQRAAATSSTRSSTPIPALTLSPVKPDRTNRHAATDGVRLFHLTRSGQSRDTPPVKLFVRAVGEHGERVMVRVGGGWADLAEYLREYSLHHGHRGLPDGGLEVANFPTSQSTQRDSPSSVSSSSVVNYSKPNGASPQTLTKKGSLPGMSNGHGELSPLNIGKIRNNGRGKFTELSSPVAGNTSMLPPVPPIPTTYTVQSPTTFTTTTDGVTTSGTIEPIDLGLSSGLQVVPSQTMGSDPVNRSSRLPVTTTPGISNATSTYTPLGAAGPVSANRRAVSHTMSTNVVRDSWVDGMVDKARAVSGGTTVIHGPTMTTTTTVISRPSPRNRRVVSTNSPKPAGSPNVSTPISPPVSTPVSKPSPPPTQEKNRMSLGEVSGIKRVFLRRKSEKR